MDKENLAETFEETDVAEVTTDATDNAIDDDWYSDGFAERPESEEPEQEDADNADDSPEADQPEDEPADDTDTTGDDADTTKNNEQPTEDQPETQAEEPADQRFTLKHLGEIREVSRDEVIELAQKGMDYDRKTQKLGDQIAEYEEFLTELAQPTGLSIPQLMDSVRAHVLQENEKAAGREITEAEALLRVQQARADKKKAAEDEAQAEAQREQAAAEQRRHTMLSDFANARPDVKATDIPKSVWDEAGRTGDLIGAFAKYENVALRKEKTEYERRISTFEKNAKNAQRSTGSRKSAGKATEQSAFDALWYNGT